MAIMVLCLVAAFSDLSAYEDSGLENDWVTEVEQVLSTFDASYVYPEMAVEMRSII